MAKVIMTSSQYIERIEIIANRPTYYSNKYPNNLCYIHSDGRTSADCWNLIKALLNGYDVNNHTVGYYQKDLSNTGDCDGATLMSKCTDVSTDFTKLVSGIPEMLYMSGHAGSYIGNRVFNGHEYNVVECTGSWERKVLYSWVDSDGTRRRWKGGTKNGKWLKHGKMTPWVSYNGVIPAPTPSPSPSPAPAPKVTKVKVNCELPMIQKGSKGSAVKVWQTIVGVTTDGDFGNNTKNATTAFQKKVGGIAVDGIVGKDTWTAGLNSLQ